MKLLLAAVIAAMATAALAEPVRVSTKAPGFAKPSNSQIWRN